MRTIPSILLALMLFPMICVVEPTLAQAATYYVAKTGRPGAQGTEADPFLTIVEGSKQLEPGDTLLIREGTYHEAMYHGQNGFAFVNGTMDAFTRYSSYPGEKAVLLAPSGYFAVAFATTSAFIELSDLVIDGTNATSYTVKFSMNAQTYVAGHHIHLLRNEIKNGRSGISNGATSCKIIGNDIHHARGYGIYAGLSHDGSGGLFEGNVIHDNGGYAIHLYAEGYGADNNIIRNNVMYRNGRNYIEGGVPRPLPAVIIGRGKNNKMYNNVIYDNFAGLTVQATAPDTFIANNTVYNNDAWGMIVSSPTARVVNNLVWENQESPQIHSATGTILETNWTTDPKVVDAANLNFRLLFGSPAIDAGTTVSEITTDITGFLRGVPYDIGAYELNEAPNAPTGVQVQ